MSRDQNLEEFEGAVVGLGGLGIVTQLTLDISPTFDMRQDLYENLPLSELEGHFDEITSQAYSVSLFTDWRNGIFNQVWLKDPISNRTSPLPTLFGATLAKKKLHPIGSLSAENCTEQMGVHGPWFERMPHFRMDFTPSSGEELQTEYLIDRSHALAAIRMIDGLKEKIAPLLQISEVRTVAADHLWMSPSYQRDSVCLHFTWKKDWNGVQGILPIIEDKLEAFDARPHWGKLFMISAARLRSLYEKMSDFRALLERYDPHGKFRNDFLDKYIFG
jgi:xylitol oxidase